MSSQQQLNQPGGSGTDDLYPSIQEEDFVGDDDIGMMVGESRKFLKETLGDADFFNDFPDDFNDAEL